jgi:hypothetical protein
MKVILVYTDIKISGQHTTIVAIGILPYNKHVTTLYKRDDNKQREIEKENKNIHTLRVQNSKSAIFINHQIMLLI